MPIPELESGIVISSEESTKKDNSRNLLSRLSKTPRGIGMVRTMRRGRRSRRYTPLTFETDF